jgi:indolepyruvate ferredoxin oxidoreductase alpha subunit
MTVAAFDISEKFRVPVMLRLTTRTSHSSSLVDLGDFAPARRELIPYKKDISHTIPVPMFARMQRKAAQERTKAMSAASSESVFNRIEEGDKSLGIITSGVAYQYVKEVFPEFSVLKLGWTNPLPVELVKKFASSVEKVLVVEELDPFLEDQIKILGIKTVEHETDLDIFELNPDRLKDLRREILGDIPPSCAAKPDTTLPTRPPVLCAGCGHRSVYEAINLVLKEYEGSKVFGDIGCYTLGALPPFQALDSTIDMGASITMAKGAADAGIFPAVAIIGDSTFTHSGMTGLLDAVNANSPITVIISDNLTTGMTGGQDSAGTNKFEAICKGIGVDPEHLKVVVTLPQNMEEITRILREEINYRGLSVIIPRRECIQTLTRKAKAKNKQ